MNAKHPSTVPSAVYKVRAFATARRHLKEETGGPAYLTWGRQGAVWVMTEYSARSIQGHCARVVTEQGRLRQQRRRPYGPLLGGGARIQASQLPGVLAALSLTWGTAGSGEQSCHPVQLQSAVRTRSLFGTPRSLDSKVAQDTGAQGVGSWVGGPIVLGWDQSRQQWTGPCRECHDAQQPRRRPGRALCRAGCWAESAGV